VVVSVVVRVVDETIVSVVVAVIVVGDVTVAVVVTVVVCGGWSASTGLMLVCDQRTATQKTRRRIPKIRFSHFSFNFSGLLRLFR